MAVTVSLFTANFQRICLGIATPDLYLVIEGIILGPQTFFK